MFQYVQENNIRITSKSNMKKILLSIAFLCATFANAQTLKFDLNKDGKENKADLSFLVNYLMDKDKKYDNQYNNHEYVDLGLSVKWATMNIGATEVAGSKTNPHTGQLDCFGEYYAWAETEPKDEYTWANLKYCKNGTSTFTKYIGSSSYGTIDEYRILELTQTCDDAARSNWGGSWRMPTYAELQELMDNCYWEWTKNYNSSDVKGYIIYKAKDNSDKGKKTTESSSSQTTASYSLADTHIFLPAAGLRENSAINHVGSCCYYWLSEVFSKYSDAAYCTDVRWNQISYEIFDRCKGLTVRAVCQ